jgi:hypothetical protein
MREIQVMGVLAMQTPTGSGIAAAQGSNCYDNHGAAVATALPQSSLVLYAGKSHRCETAKFLAGYIEDKHG